MHVWADYIYIEVIDPDTGAPVPDGEVGELVLTTLRKEGAPLIRYRTHDLTRIIPGDCACGCRHPRIDTLVGRTDDMFKVKGCNMFPRPGGGSHQNHERHELGVPGDDREHQRQGYSYGLVRDASRG